MIDQLQTTALSLAWLVAIFVPLEWARPAWPGQSRRRIGIWADFAFFLGQYLLFGAIAVWLLVVVTQHVSALPVLAALQAAVAELPTAAQLGLALVLGDLVAYWGHRLQHRVDILWRFHAVHHTAEKLDFLAAHREHPIDGLYTQTLINLPAIALGLSLEHAMGLVAFRSLWAILIHANVRLPLGPLRMLFGAPELHHWHHARGCDIGNCPTHPSGVNFANLAPWIDWLFGTYRRLPTEPRDLGIDEPHPRSFIGLLLWPLTGSVRLPDGAGQRRFGAVSGERRQLRCRSEGPLRKAP
jgi:sterol desaturase/sphingolipid hydroxylase (fatty acid hydroxylase superfamily)